MTWSAFLRRKPRCEFHVNVVITGEARSRGCHGRLESMDEGFTALPRTGGPRHEGSGAVIPFYRSCLVQTLGNLVPARDFLHAYSYGLSQWT